MNAAPDIICVQIAAMGGQGGGVLAGWLAETARRAGFPAQSTSIPGVAQRTGATTYYVELFPQKHPPRSPVFSLFPDTGGLDLMVALEPAEAGRALQNRLISLRTTVLSARQRLYSTSEKSAAAGHPASGDDILEPLSATAGKTIALDIATLARAAGGMGNAVFLGAICASGVLPMAEEHYRAAIEAGGNASANLAGFDAGLAAMAAYEGSKPRQPGAPEKDTPYSPPPPELAQVLAPLPENLRPMAGHALARLVDYQSRAYARLYLERLETVIAADRSKDKALSRMVARRLAAWMSFEDVIRVAQLKTRPGRFARIREEVGIGPGDPLRVTDYLKPGRDEIIAILPRFLGRLLPGGSGPGRPLRLATSHIPGFAAMRLLASLKPLRPLSAGYHKEQAAISRWLDALILTAPEAPELALQLADAALCVRGYGRVRHRGMAALDAMLLDWTNRLHHNRAKLAGDIATFLHNARTNPDCLPTE
jgi:indolepyruvate ferredoxin oxidoreductase beta subunit